jgi:membrane associated rhomboid family serine protease
MYFCYFYPTGLDIRRRRQPWLSAALIGLLVVVFCWQRWLPDLLPVHPWDLIFYVGGGRPWTAITALFLHGSWLHLLGNLVYLAAFLPSLEDRLGRVGVAMLVLVAGVGGNLAHGLVAWQGWFGQGGLGILGISGAISGLLGFALVRLPYARVAVAYWVFAPFMGQNRAGRSHVPLPAAVLLWLLLQVVNALVSAESGSMVSYGAHLGGFAMGLLLAVVLGGIGEGRAESRLATARRYLERGEGWAAVGAFTEYFELIDQDDDARVELARALLLTGPTGEAAAQYRAVYRRQVRAGRWDLALQTLAEGRRSQPGLGLDPGELADAAHHADKVGQRDLATHIYSDLVSQRSDHPACQRAWVRLVLLLHADPDRQEEAAQWLDQARRELPPGAWRDYLEREFSPRETPRAEPAATVAGPTPAPGS